MLLQRVNIICLEKVGVLLGLRLSPGRLLLEDATFHAENLLEALITEVVLLTRSVDAYEVVRVEGKEFSSRELNSPVVIEDCCR